MNEQLVTCAADFIKVREITEKLQTLQAESDRLYEEYGNLI